MPIDAALYSRSKCYFFHGSRYMRVTRGDTGPGTADPGYPANISNWGWKRELIVVHFKSLLPITSAIKNFIDAQFSTLESSDFLMWPNISWTNPPPNISTNEASTMAASNLTGPRPF